MSEDRITGDDSKAVRVCAEALRILSAKHYDPPDAVRAMGIESDRKIAEHAELVAAKIDRRRII